MEHNTSQNINNEISSNNSNANPDSTLNTPPLKTPTKPKTLIAATIICAILAIASITFGIYEFLDSNQKNQRISDLESQLITPSKPSTVPEEQNEEASNPATSSENLYLVGDLYTLRKYSLATSNTDQSLDSREISYYLVDTTKLGTSDAITPYDLSGAIAQAVDERVSELPDIIAEGTVNATAKSRCQSYSAHISEITEFTNNPKYSNWMINRDWSDKLPIVISIMCKIDGGNTKLSLGNNLYSLDPETNTLTKLTESDQL